MIRSIIFIRAPTAGFIVMLLWVALDLSLSASSQEDRLVALQAPASAAQTATGGAITAIQTNVPANVYAEAQYKQMSSVDAEITPNTFLGYAAKVSNVAMVDYAISIGASIDEADALNIACDVGNFQIIKHLLERGANVNKISHVYSRTPLQILCSRTFGIGGHYAVTRWRDLQLAEVASCLVKAGADINEKETFYGDTPLMTALRTQNPATAICLLELGANVAIVNSRGETAKSIAEEKKYTNVIDRIAVSQQK